MKQNMKKTNLLDGKGFYIALCCCVLVLAAVAYVGKTAFAPNEASKKTSDSVEVEENTPLPAALFHTSKTPSPTVKPTPAAKPAAAPQNTPLATHQMPKEVTKTPSPPPEPEFSAPLLGTVIGTFSDGTLVYNKALDDWRVHDGVDLKAEAGTEVSAAADGVIEEISYGVLGKYMVIDHKNGFKTLYANLDENIALCVGDKVKKGDVIAKVGNTSVSEEMSEPHLHFELLEDGKAVNPMDYLK